eukprot:g1761.t1
MGDGEVEAADQKRCGAGGGGEAETVRINDAEWAGIVEKTCKKYPICRDLGDGGVVGTTDFELRAFNGLIQFQITGQSVRLIVHGSEGHTNVASEGCGDSTNTMELAIYINDISYTGRDKTVSKGWLGGTNEKTSGIDGLPWGFRAHEVKLKIAVDARLVYIPSSDKWVVRGEPNEKNKDVHVCIPKLKLGSTFINAIASMFVSVKTIISDKLFCAFKYTIPNVPALKGLLDFTKTHRGLPTTERPKIGLSVRKALSAVDARAQKYTAKLDFQTQFQVPTRPFIRYLLTSATDAAAKNQKPKRELSDAETKDLEEKEAKAKAAGLDTDSLKSGLEDAQAALDEAAKQLLDEGNQALAGTVESAANLLFGLKNNLKGTYQGGFALEKTTEKQDTKRGKVHSKKVKVDVDEFSLTVTAKDTKIPLSLFARGLASTDGEAGGDGIQAAEAEIIAGRAINEQDWEAARSNAVLLSGDIDVYRVADLEIEGNILSLIGE